jgi:predicted TIM-barrel fold metal-dependent hydrolase
MHVGSFGPQFGVSLDQTGLETLMREYDIGVGLVFAPDNDHVRQVVEAVDAAYGLYWGNPRLPGNLERASEFLDHPKFVGMKLHPLLDGYHPNDPSVHPFVELCIPHDLPILIHCGHEIFTLPWSIEELAVSYPAAKIILGHMGHGNVVYINGSIDVATRNPNVYLETSGMPMHSKIREAIERVGPTRVLFGSDVPSHHPTIEIMKVQLSGLPPDLVERVLNSNGRLLFFGDDAAERPLGNAEAANANGAE